MCGLWVALEDVGPENGTLFYYPGSHRLPRLSNDELGLGFRNPNSTRPFNPDIARSAQEAYLERQLALSGLQRESFAAPRGSVILWAAGLVHGGSKILSPGRSRWSQVTHYFFHDCLYTTPMHCADFIGDFYLRRVRDVATGEVVPNRYYGLPVEGVEDNYLYKLVTDVVGDRERVIASTDCGFGTFAGREWVIAPVVWEKLDALRQGARIASQRLWVYKPPA